MPIKDKGLYPPDWPARSLAAKSDAGWCCEKCRAVNGRPHPETGSTVVLTVHHIIPVADGGTHDKSNLQALCQRCHLAADGALHARHAAMTREGKRRAEQADAGQEALKW